MATASKGQSWRITHVARHLGVSRQRAQQLAHADRLPPPLSIDAVGPSWDPNDTRHWAEGWLRERPWRRLVRNFATDACYGSRYDVQSAKVTDGHAEG